MVQRLDRTSMSVLKWASNKHSNLFVTYVKDVLTILQAGQ